MPYWTALHRVLGISRAHSSNRTCTHQQWHTALRVQGCKCRNNNMGSVF